MMWCLCCILKCMLFCFGQSEAMWKDELMRSWLGPTSMVEKKKRKTKEAKYTQRHDRDDRGIGRSYGSHYITLQVHIMGIHNSTLAWHHDSTALAIDRSSCVIIIIFFSSFLFSNFDPVSVSLSHRSVSFPNIYIILARPTISNCFIAFTSIYSHSCSCYMVAAATNRKPTECTTPVKHMAHMKWIIISLYIFCNVVLIDSITIIWPLHMVIIMQLKQWKWKVLVNVMY